MSIFIAVIGNNKRFILYDKMGSAKVSSLTYLKFGIHFGILMTNVTDNGPCIKKLFDDMPENNRKEPR